MGFKEPKIKEMDRITLAGFNFYGDPFTTSDEWTEENEIGRTWKRFMEYMTNNNKKVEGLFKNEIAYEVHLWNEDTHAKGHFDVFVGMEVTDLKAVPYDLLVRILPPCKYAVFTLRGDEISSDWHQSMYVEWLPQSGYKNAHNYQFQYYDQRFKGPDKLNESELDVYLPIVR
jgi:predicted transcriptional regulator YdeE